MDTRQREFLQQAVLGLSTSVVHTIICLFYFLNDYMRLDGSAFAILFGAIWLGNFVFISIYLSGQNMKFKDPVLTVPLMVWIALGIVISAYYVEVFRLSVMMIFFGVLLVGAFRLKFLWFMTIAILTLLGYGYVLFLVVETYPTEVTMSVEILEWIMFSIVAVSIAFTGTRISALQTRLHAQHGRLNEALEKIQELAMKDELTGLYNRRHIMQVLEEQKNVADTGDYSFVICYMDLDHFKAVNDTWGHHVGDIVLKRFSSTVQRLIRTIDYGGRLGGEEFIVVLAKTNLEGANVVAERIRASIEEENFDEVAEGLTVTCSIGLTEYRPTETIEELMHRADGLLYEAKEGGRNRIIVASDS